MMSQTPSQMPPASSQEVPYEMSAQPMARPQAGYRYDYGEQYLQTLAEQVAPRVATILGYRTAGATPGQRLALAIVSLALNCHRSSLKPSWLAGLPSGDDRNL